MAKVVANKQVTSFTKGLITEVNPLTFPDNASVDEVNFDLLKTGLRKRRLGMDYEDAYTYTSTGLSATILQSLATTDTFIWNAPGGDPTKSVLCVKLYNIVYFFDATAANPSSVPLSLGGVTSVTLDAIMKLGVTTWATVNGMLLLASSSGGVSYIAYTSTSPSSITTGVIFDLYVRDVFGVYENVAIDDRPTALTYTHNYNLLNQGWNKNLESIVAATTPIDQTFLVVNPGDATGLNRYPSNADIMSYGKESNPASGNYEKYSALVMFRNSINQGNAPKGRFIIKSFKRGNERLGVAAGLWSAAATGGLLLDYDVGGCSCVATYAGRAWYSGVKIFSKTFPDPTAPNLSGFVFFTQIVKSSSELTKCYQENDPTSPDQSDILDTDGGTINIPEATNINALVPLGASLLVFAENGIWQISGSDTSVFTPTAYTVTKLSSIGTLATESIVVAGDTVFFWAPSGIFALTQEAATGRLGASNISLSTIQTMYEAIPSIGRQYARGIYDEQKNVVSWLYNDSSTYSTSNYINTYTKQLNFDLAFSAFYPYEFSSLNVGVTSLPRVSGIIQTPSYIAQGVNYQVINSIGDTVVNAAVNNVIISGTTNTSRESRVRYIITKGSTFTVGYLKNTAFKDWYTEDSTGVDAAGYLVTGYDTSGEIAREKQAPNATIFFERTEGTFYSSGGVLYPSTPSSCLIQTQWNWANSANSGKWGREFQAYRLTRNYIPYGAGDPFDYGFSVISTKNLLRGSGKCLSMKLSTEAEKDCRVLGWALDVTANSET